MPLKKVWNIHFHCQSLDISLCSENYSFWFVFQRRERSFSWCGSVFKRPCKRWPYHSTRCLDYAKYPDQTTTINMFLLLLHTKKGKVGCSYLWNFTKDQPLLGCFLNMCIMHTLIAALFSKIQKCKQKLDMYSYWKVFW